MSKFFGNAYFDGGLTAFKTNVNLMGLVKAYSDNDDYATVFGNIVASAALVSTDMIISGGSGAARVLTIATKTDTSADAASGVGPNLHIAYLDTVNSVIYAVTNETTDQVVTIGSTIVFPSITLTVNQPS